MLNLDSLNGFYISNLGLTLIITLFNVTSILLFYSYVPLKAILLLLCFERTYETVISPSPASDSPVMTVYHVLQRNWRSSRCRRSAWAVSVRRSATVTARCNVRVTCAVSSASPGPTGRTPASPCSHPPMTSTLLTVSLTPTM